MPLSWQAPPGHNRTTITPAARRRPITAGRLERQRYSSVRNTGSSRSQIAFWRAPSVIFLAVKSQT